MKLGILDQMAQPKGMTAEETAAHSIELAKYAESIGYERYWFAEHHATKGLASSSPEIMMAAIAASTSRLKVGSGGILLPQYSSYKVASQLLQLQILFPGRIEGGVGRSSGGNEKVRSLLADGKPNQMEEYPEKLTDLVQFLNQKGPIRATPRATEMPKLFSLGLGENSAEIAAKLGIGYVYGHFLNPTKGKEALHTYRTQFQPHYLEEPEQRGAVFIVCGESDKHAEELALSQDAWLLRAEKGTDSRIPTVEEAASIDWTNEEKEKIQANRKRMIIGGPDKVKHELVALSERYNCHDWLVLTNIYDFKEKKRSYRRIIELFK